MHNAILSGVTLKSIMLKFRAYIIYLTKLGDCRGSVTNQKLSRHATTFVHLSNRVHPCKLVIYLNKVKHPKFGEQNDWCVFVVSRFL